MSASVQCSSVCGVEICSPHPILLAEGHERVSDRVSVASQARPSVAKVL